MIKNKLKFRKQIRKAGFTLIEVLAAIVISSISLLAMIKISVEATKQSIVNQAGDRATQIYSSTAQSLLNLKGSTAIAGTYFCTATGGSANNPAQDTFKPIFLLKVPVTNPPNTYVMKLDVSPSSTDRLVNEPASDALATQSNASTLQYNIDFVQDQYMEDADKANGFYRSIAMNYKSDYKTVNVRIVIYWNLYGVDHYYVNYNIFNVSDC